MTSTIDLNCATIDKLPSGIIRITYKEGLEIKLNDAQQVEKAFYELAEEKHIYSLMMSLGRFIRFSRDAQDYFATKATIISQVRASAMVLDSLPVRLIAKFFIRFHKMHYPTRIFSSEKAAHIWLEEVREMNAMKSVG